MDLCGSRYGPVAGSCELSNEPSIKWREICRLTELLLTSQEGLSSRGFTVVRYIELFLNIMGNTYIV
jgi:hypothetical protein